MTGSSQGEHRIIAVNVRDDGLAGNLRAAGADGGRETVFYPNTSELPAEWTDGTADLLVIALPTADLSRVRQALAWAAETAAGIRSLVIVEAASRAEINEVFEAGADECVVAPIDATALRRIVARLIDARESAIRSLFLHETIRIMEDCRPLAYCLEPGQLYPLTLDLLLRATSRRRGFTLFKRENVPQSDAVALRGFEAGETTPVCRTLLGDKAIDLVVSMGGEGNESGIVALFDDGRPFLAQDVERADIVTRHGIAALQNSETYALAKERAFVDDVTQAYNAGYLLETFENEIQRSERYGSPLSVLFLDLDHFKDVNDEYGHLVGSEALRRLCRVLEQCVRQVDTLARYGGDEFAVLLVDTDHAMALEVAERIRRRIHAYVFEVDRDIRLSLTVSIGVSTCPAHGVVRDRLLDLADKAMYRAKSEGRNRICSASDVS